MQLNCHFLVPFCLSFCSLFYLFISLSSFYFIGNESLDMCRRRRERAQTTIESMSQSQRTDAHTRSIRIHEHMRAGTYRHIAPQSAALFCVFDTIYNLICVHFFFRFLSILTSRALSLSESCEDGSGCLFHSRSR